MAAAEAESEPGRLLPRRRRNAHRVDPKVLEARLSKRYEVFSLPESVCTLVQQPAHEKDWERLEQLASIIQGAARGIRDVSEETVAAASQEQAWIQIPLSPFGEFIRSDRACGAATLLHVLWSKFEATATTAHACFLRLCLDLGQVLWQQQCQHWTL